MSETTSKRLDMLRAHLPDSQFVSENPGNAAALQPLECCPTAAFPQEEDSYCVVLPERLTPQGPWLVRRLVNFFDFHRRLFFLF